MMLFQRSATKKVPPAIPAVGRGALQAVADLAIQLKVDGPIVPGESIRFSWSATTISILPLDLGQVTFSLSLVDEYGNIDPSGQLYSVTLPKNEAVTPGNYVSKKYAVQLTGDLASRVYKLGSQVLRLLVSGTGNDGPFESDDVTLIVNGEPIDFTWWQWTVPLDRQVQWKVDKPPVQGNVINRSQYASITCTATIFETNFTDGDGTSKEIGSDQPGAPAGPKQSVAISYGSIDFSKNWPWFISGIWVLNSNPIQRNYGYFARLDITDEFQNGYPPVNTSQIEIEFRVSDTKIAALSVATGLMAGAAVSFAAGAATICFGGATLIGLAAGMVAAAQISGKIADDPPTPDVLYRQRVLVKAISVSPKALASRDLRPLAETLALVFSILARVEALGIISGRLLGAELAGDKKARVMHEMDDQSQRRALLGDGQKLQTAAHQAGVFLAAHRGTTPQALRVAFDRWRNEPAFQNDIRSTCLKVGLTIEQFKSLDRFIRIPGGVQTLSNASRVIMSIGFWAQHLATKAANEGLGTVNPRSLNKPKRRGGQANLRKS